MHLGSGSATAQLAFPGESNPNFPWEKSPWDNTIVKKKSIWPPSCTLNLRIQSFSHSELGQVEYTTKHMHARLSMDYTSSTLKGSYCEQVFRVPKVAVAWFH